MLDKNSFFVTQLCKLSLPIEHIFPLRAEGSDHLDAHLYIQQRKQNNAQLPPFTLDLVSINFCLEEHKYITTRRLTYTCGMFNSLTKHK